MTVAYHRRILTTFVILDMIPYVTSLVRQRQNEQKKRKRTKKKRHTVHARVFVRSIVYRHTQARCDVFVDFFAIARANAKK